MQELSEATYRHVIIKPALSPPNNHDLNLVDYKILRILQQRVYKKKVEDVNGLRQRLIDVWAEVEQNVIGDSLTSRGDVFVPAFEPEKDILNIHCDINYSKCC